MQRSKGTRAKTWLGAALGVAAALGIAGSAAAQNKKVTVFIGPTPIYDSIWMADAKGYFKEEGLDVEFRLFPTGTTALQTFQTGQGDLVTNGDLPGVAYWLRANKDYRLVTLIERGSINYKATARKEIQKPQDLIGKTIATRVGSTGSWFISEYLKKNNIPEDQVKVINLDGQVLPTALCQGDISAFFIWQPFGARALQVCPDKAHYLSSAEGYVNGYAVLAARPGWLATPEGKDITTRFLRAMRKGLDVAAKDFEAVAQYANAKFSLTRDAIEDQWKTNGRIMGFDKIFYDDYCSLAAWMRANKQMDEKMNFAEFIWTDAAKALDPKLVTDPPPPC